MKTEPEDEDSEESSANNTDANTSSGSNGNMSKSTIEERSSPSPLDAGSFNAANNDKPFRDRFDSDDDDNFWWAMDESDNEKGADPLPVKVELEEGSGNENPPEVPVKRKRGRPKGSKTVNRKADKEKNAKGKFTCPTCGKDLKFKSHLVRHAKMHKDEKKKKRKKKKNKQKSPYTVSSSEDDDTDCDKDSFFDCVSEDETMRLEQVKEEPLDDEEEREGGDDDLNESIDKDQVEEGDQGDKPMIEGEVKIKKKRGRKKKSEMEGTEWSEIGPDGEVRKKRERKKPKEPCICGVCGKDLRYVLFIICFLVFLSSCHV